MPNCEFYGAPGDFEPILQFIFDELRCRVLEAYSDFDRELREFSSIEDLARSTALGDCSKGWPSCYVMLWPVAASDQVRIRRIELSQPNDLGTFRYCAEGWGVIVLQLGGLSDRGLHPSRTTHNSEKRAHKWADTGADRMGDPLAWDWKLVDRTSGRLNRRIRSLACGKIGSRPVLPAAQKVVDAGAHVLTN